MLGITLFQACQYIDKAAKDDLVYHYNGGQVYIKLHEQSDILMVIDHTNANGITVELLDGHKYFKTYAEYRWAYSKRMRENSLTELFSLVS